MTAPTVDPWADIHECAENITAVIGVFKERYGSAAFYMVDPNGRPLLADLLAAQANILVAIAAHA